MSMSIFDTEIEIIAGREAMVIEWEDQLDDLELDAYAVEIEKLHEREIHAQQKKKLDGKATRQMMR